MCRGVACSWALRRGRLKWNSQTCQGVYRIQIITRVPVSLYSGNSRMKMLHHPIKHPPTRAAATILGEVANPEREFIRAVEYPPNEVSDFQPIPQLKLEIIRNLDFRIAGCDSLGRAHNSLRHYLFNTSSRFINSFTSIVHAASVEASSAGSALESP